jgi:N-carbamoylputrescine amidase
VSRTANLTKTIRIGLVQMACGPILEENLEKAVHFIREAAEQGAQLVCLQELFRSQYFCQVEDVARFDLAEPIPGPTTSRLGEVARSHALVLIASLFEKRDAGIYHNTAVVFDADGTLLGKYRKMHIPDDPLYYEKFYFTPGDQGFPVYDTRLGCIGTLVCWDQWFPEAARLMALQGAKIIFYPTAIGWHPSERSRYGVIHQEAWKTIQRAHAIANGIYVAAINRVGHEILAGQGIEFWGSSFVADPLGVILQEASTDQEEVLVVDCDLNYLEEVRRNWPFLRDRRIDSYDPITRRWID